HPLSLHAALPILYAEAVLRRRDHRSCARWTARMTAARQNVMTEFLSIEGREVGPGRPCFIVAEAGINHNGDVRIASDLVQAAAQAGADAIKFQTHFPEHEMLRDGATAAYVGESLFDLLTRTALS